MLFEFKVKKQRKNLNLDEMLKTSTGLSPNIHESFSEIIKKILKKDRQNAANNFQKHFSLRNNISAIAQNVANFLLKNRTSIIVDDLAHFL